MKAFLGRLPEIGQGGDASKKAVMDLVQSEMTLWEDVARESVAAGQSGRHDRLLRRFAAVFGGLDGAVDDDAFRPLVEEVLDEARKAVAAAVRPSY